ncbi:AAA family ATPase [Streptomyces sp. NPDC057474]|uniref:AAA family ATPase n=1 Tax=Streptomyces sp. NPDC057474 TaxID=3346144 RepID=UPI0036B06011
MSQPFGQAGADGFGGSDTARPVCQQHFQYEPCGHKGHFAQQAQQTAEEPHWEKVGMTREVWESFAWACALMDVRSADPRIAAVFGPNEETNPLWGAKQSFIKGKNDFARALKDDKELKQKQYDEEAAMHRAAKEKADRDAAQRTIGGELTPQAELFLEKLKAGMMSGDALDELPDPAPVVDGWLYEDTLNWIAGPSGTFKSFVAHDLAARYASQSMSYHGFPMEHGKALYIVAEGAGLFKFRKRAWESYNGKVSENITYYAAPVQISDFEQQMPALIAFAREGGYTMVIFDTQAMCTVGEDENQAKDMGVIINACHSLRMATKGCIILVHHFDKGGNGMRGSGAQFGAASTIVSTKRDKDEEWVTLSTKKADGGKAKDDEGRADLKLKLERYEPADGSRGSLCPLRDDPYTLKAKPVYPTFDDSRTDLLKRIAMFEDMGGMSPSAVKEFLNEAHPKTDENSLPTGDKYTTSGAEMRVKMLVTAKVVEKRSSKYWVTDFGRDTVAALAASPDDAQDDD